MRIFKFGGASVKDADGIKNVFSVLEKVGHEDTLLVISAMGKTTNALEIVIKNYFEKSAELHSSLQDVRKYHNQILLDLFDDEEQEHEVFYAVNSHFADLEYFLRSNKSPNYNFVYDQVVSYGEIVSTTIVSHYFNYAGLKNNWIDVRNFIKTNNTEIEELNVLSLHLLQSYLVYINTLMIQYILKLPHWQNILTTKDKRAISLLIHFLNLYSIFLDMNKRLAI